ncbi:hypothetical protein J1907_10275 [Lysinibacillus sphaericus]|uniref:hypothetical protein n=1 Tax=Lysinibacillus sphaericus TaxID=1421 RepID=UPI000569BFF8|nr:hypothetical protein [Lysinibacillus sphaericus]MBG9754950.1 hypothetical protein [Lysinibacillus sphaericus]QTB15460.1 hypothetical protein J2B92_09855 [Lysinibacillus sphaericus]QTB24393.1 hypothetical protein J1907_10275 [Lysinibacillus sphaericus]
MKQLLKEARALFYGWEIAFYLLIWFLANYQFFYLISKERTTSIIVGCIGALFFFLVFTVKNRQLKKYQMHLSELLKYVTNMIFFLQTGENVLHALKETKATVHPDIQNAIEVSIQQLEKEAKLNTNQFEKYDFPTLDQFHQNLKIKYEHGGNPDDLFSQIHKNMIFELKKRDELYRKRRGFAMAVYMLLGMVMGISLMLRFIVGGLWDTFLNVGFAGIGVLLITQVFALLNLYFLQKRSMDISIRY